MKVLHVAQYIYNKNYKEFTKNKSGLGIMAQDICSALADYDEVFLLTHAITPGHKNKYTILRHTWLDVIKNLRLRNLCKGFKAFAFTKTTLWSKIHLMYYAINIGCLDYWIKKINPDVIHIHEYTPPMMGFIELCYEKNRPLVVTCHGLLGEKKCEQYIKDSEKKIVGLYNKKSFYLTTISTSIRDKLIKYYDVENDKKIKVVLNGIVRKNIPIKAGSKNNYTLLCVGQLSERKNQGQVMEAVSMLDENLKNRIKLYLIGNDTLNGELLKKADELGLQSRVICTGFVERDKLGQYYEAADGLIVASLDEGFGLPIVESMMYGVPVVMFSDLDAVKDLYSEDAFVLVSRRTTEAFSEGIEELVNRSWDKALIQAHAQKFSLESMGMKYHEIYGECCLEKK